MAATAEQIVKEVNDLVSLPEVAVRVNRMVDSPNYAVADVGKVIAQDPALTARLLKVANSPFYGLSTKIDTVSRAVSVLGSRQIRDLVFATSVTKVFDGLQNDLISMDDFWTHSICCGLAAKILAEKIGNGVGESIFIGGLLHDIGRLIMFKHLPELARKALLASIEGPDESLSVAERAFMTFDHAELGAALVRHWNMPASLQEIVGCHHDITKAKRYRKEVAIVQIANAIAVMVELDTLLAEDAPAIQPLAWELTGLDPSILEPTMEKVNEDLSAVKSMLGV